VFIFRNYIRKIDILYITMKNKSNVRLKIEI